MPSYKCCRNTKLIRNISRKHNHNKLYDTGVTKLNSELDCIEFVQTIRKLKILGKIILDENQQMLANLTSQQILETNKKLPKKIKSADTLSFEL